ncbi:hypothetical protein LCGC14_0710570 [marine sediment metagenome]|uniref:Calcineurin-like phosphoesterase n=2 Tax=root TaxID=1 RepID=A0A831VM92_9FLAO|nr:hypothetical protein [Pricia antarctica]
MIRIIHLTDFHLNKKNLDDWKSYIKKALIQKLSNIHDDGKITFIAFTGDLIDIGGKDFESAEMAFKFFKTEIITPILDALRLPIENFLIVPGNHDVVRDNDSIREELGNKAYFVNHQNISEFIKSAIEKEDFEGMKRMEPYKKFERELYKDVGVRSNITMFGSSFMLNENDTETSVGVACLNSSWRCYDENDKGSLLIGERQLISQTEFIDKALFKVCLLHHPLDALSDIENSIISSHIYKEFDLVLIGDIHENSTAMVSGVTGNSFVNIAASGLNDIRSDSRRYSNGFTIVDTDLVKNEICVKYFKYVHKSKSFVLDTDASGNDDGTFCQSIPDREEKIFAKTTQTILDSIKSNHYDLMDNHMIGVRAEIEVASIKEAFVLPPINRGNSLSEDDVCINLSQIVKSNNSHIFFGNKESGKTVLLYRLVREYVDEYQHIRRIPAYVNVDELGNKEIITAVREYLSCSIADVKELLENKEIVLLLDNLNYNEADKNVERLKRVNRFSEEYDGIQIIATGEGNISGSMPPMDYIKYCEIPFKKYFIQNLSAKEIKSIMKMWTPQINVTQLGERLDKLVSDFKSYALPSTAMSVSLFLWSTENNDRKPINSAVLLEIYVETILEKLNQENIYRNTFDFKNKLQLLSKIAQEMLINDEDDYSLKYSEFIRVIETYLNELVGFDYESSVIANYFLERKIFIRFKGDRVKFMYSCFFHFFLAKRMEFNADFKDFILSEKEYFKFSDEINYYTGLTRSDKALFETIFERFKNEFSKTDFVSDQLKGKWDKFFIIRNKDKSEENEKYESVAKRTEIVQIKENRPSEKMMEEIQNRRLLDIREPGKILKKNGDVSLERLLLIMSNVLRNSEGVEDFSLKKDAYNTLIKYLLIWTVLYREYLLDYILTNKKLPQSFPNNMPVARILMDVPIFVQGGMFKHLGSAKLAPVILSKIKADSLGLNSTKSDLESYISVALYADVQGSGFPTHLKNFIKRVKNNPVRDYLHYKLAYYYYTRTSKGSSNEELYLGLLTDLRIKSQNLPGRMKEAVKKQIQDSKKKFLGNN